MNSDSVKSIRSNHYLVKIIQHTFPIITWLPRYSVNDAVSDLIAGITVGLTAMPQSLAYATLAGLEPQYGLYSAFAGCLVYVIFGSCKDITIGPTALMSLMTYQQVVNRNADFAVLLCFLTGIVQVLLGILHLGVLVDFISVPVTVGFTSATSIIIVVSQLKGLLGLRYQSEGFLDSLHKLRNNICDTKFNDACLGIICIILLLGLRKIKDIKINDENDRKYWKWKKNINKTLWLISVSRNAIVVIGSSVFAYVYSDSSDNQPVVILTGNVRSGFPSFKPPPFETVVDGNNFSFSSMCIELGYSIVLVPIIAVLGNVAIAKAFANDSVIDATQELYTLGLCNIIGSLFSSMPVTGSFSRSAVNHVSGVRTPLGGLYTGILIILSLSLLTPYFYYIPKCSLAAVIICAVIFMIEYEVVKPMWKCSRKDLIPTFATFLLCLAIGVEIGILIGVAINIAFILISSARPALTFKNYQTSGGHEYMLITPGNSFYFPAIDYLKAKICKIGIRYGYSYIPVVIDCNQISVADFTAAKGIASLTSDFKQRRQPLYFLNPRLDVLNVLKCFCPSDVVDVTGFNNLDNIITQYYAENKLTSDGTTTGGDCDIKGTEIATMSSRLQAADSGLSTTAVEMNKPLEVNIPLLETNTLRRDRIIE